MKNLLIYFLLLMAAHSTFAQGKPRFTDNFENGLKSWEIHGQQGAAIQDSGDKWHKHILILKPQGDVLALVRGSAAWGNVRIEGDVLFPTNIDNYLGIAYNFHNTGTRKDFGLIYIKGNDSYLSVNPHRDFNVGRTLYEEYRTPLKGSAAIKIGEWQHFKVEIIDNMCHFYVGDMNAPQLTFSSLELSSGAIGLQPRSVGGDVWIDNIQVTSIKSFSYAGPPRPDIKYEPESLLTDWKVSEPFLQTNDEIARLPFKFLKWRTFATDNRGAVITGRIVDYHGSKTVAYLQTQFVSKEDKQVFLHISTVDDLALWVNGKFEWFIPRSNLAWYDFWQKQEHKGQRIPITLKRGTNEIVLRVRGGVYASGGFFVRIEQ